MSLLTLVHRAREDRQCTDHHQLAGVCSIRDPSEEFFSNQSQSLAWVRLHFRGPPGWSNCLLCQFDRWQRQLQRRRTGFHLRGNRSLAIVGKARKCSAAAERYGLSGMWLRVERVADSLRIRDGASSDQHFVRAWFMCDSAKNRRLNQRATARLERAQRFHLQNETAVESHRSGRTRARQHWLVAMVTNGRQRNGLGLSMPRASFCVHGVYFG